MKIGLAHILAVFGAMSSSKSVGQYIQCVFFTGDNSLKAPHITKCAGALQCELFSATQCETL